MSTVQSGFLLQTLMDSERVEEAVQLAEHSGAIGMSQEQYHQLCRTLHQRAGFIKLVQGFYYQAQEYFIKGAVDVREVNSCIFLFQHNFFMLFIIWA